MSTHPLTQEQHLLFMGWRAAALDRMPYFAQLLFSLRPVHTPGLGTYAVDKFHRVYVDFDAVVSKGPQWNVESLLHECLHLLSAHFDLAAEIAITPAQQQAWNFAADCSINDDLVEAGCTTLDTGADPLPRLLGEPNGFPATYYYSVVKKKQSQSKKNNRSGGSGQPQNSQSQPQQGFGQPSAEQGSGDPQSAPEGYKGCGSGSGGEPAPFELGQDNDLGGTAPAATSTEREYIRIKTAHDMAEAAKSRGTLPGGMSELATKILTPSQVPWQRLLGSYMRAHVARVRGTRHTDWTRRSRRRHRQPLKNAQGAILGNIVYPGSSRPNITVEAIRDTSGSMSARDLGLATREIKKISQRMGIRGKNLIVTDVDASVHESRKFTSEASVAEVYGRGGTDMRVGIAAACEREQPPSVVVVLTDGGTPWPTERPSVPVVAAIVCPKASYQMHTQVVPHFIKTVHIPSGVE